MDAPTNLHKLTVFFSQLLKELQNKIEAMQIKSSKRLVRTTCVSCLFTATL